MDDRDQADGFYGIDTIVSEPLKFKVKLAIGEDAYTSLKVKNAVVQVWDVAGVATTAAVVAKSSVVASTFFAPTGWLAALGIGTAVTPVGWVIAAAVFSGGAWFGITRHLKKASADKVTVVPNFINTPLDVLALGLFDLLVPLALKVATDDGALAGARRRQVHDYLVREWGYDADFVAAGMRYIEFGLEDLSVRELARTLAGFAADNRDCNFTMMSQEILGFLRNMVEVDGQVEPGDADQIEKIAAIFKSAGKGFLRKKLVTGWRSVRQGAGRVFSRAKSTDGNA